uniref:Uncharacterized protein n=1 Tax=Chromera velia CCMP2878 TaxID=1169474 RepID=A0A0G4H3M8_9ALVE|eukprot:Cvel_24505.t1-p1 / transcript=Cvel_24505.t1 / gene=Cvel_24505 / organism=Chromera_velia_CCMP2878 / gene_product=hypothetical protein / transcript_product=hypothetical protein / location=Cvel_scaffold2658:17625-18185(+) / protein_length=187 / sequence_SO=supercontig / SO=protein_coding / is_pseudo=false
MSFSSLQSRIDSLAQAAGLRISTDGETFLKDLLTSVQLPNRNLIKFLRDQNGEYVPKESEDWKKVRNEGATEQSGAWQDEDGNWLVPLLISVPNVQYNRRGRGVATRTEYRLHAGTNAYLTNSHSPVPRGLWDTSTVLTISRAVLGVSEYGGDFSQDALTVSHYEGNATVIRTVGGKVFACTSLHTF